jgi:homoaconitate hydratase family protein/3-isopropylmalate dehydratase small subunit
MEGRTFVEKVLEAPAGEIVFAKPNLVLSHDNTSSIESIFKKMDGKKVADATQLLVVLDHNAPPTDSNLANKYEAIRDFVQRQGITKFHDAGDGICHQLMSNHAKPGMIIVGSDSHTCTAGAFNTLAVGIDRTETAGIWKTGETWFKVPETLKIELTGELRKYVAAKDVALYIIGMLGSSGADYLSIEFHGEGVSTLSMSDRMTIANLASEMGAKNAVFPPDSVLSAFLGYEAYGSWADKNAIYKAKYQVNLSEMEPLVACPHHVDNVKKVSELAEIPVQQALIGTCTNGRIEDLRAAANILHHKTIPSGFQLLVTPASKAIYLQAIHEGVIEILLKAGANILSSSCGPCLGTGQGIPADNVNVVSTANRNFLGRMGNKNANIYLASPETVAYSALQGKLASPFSEANGKDLAFRKKQTTKTEITEGENRKSNGVWDYADVDNLNTDQMFAGNLTYKVSSTEPENILPHLFAGFDASFASKVASDDVLVCGENFGCGSSREHPAVGLRFAGVKAVIVKSVSRIFFRSSINQGLPIIILPDAVEVYKKGDVVLVDLVAGKVRVGDKEFSFAPLPPQLLKIVNAGGLVRSMSSE